MNGERTVGIRVQKLDIRWDRAVLQHQHGLNQARDARAAFRVTDIRLDRANINAMVTEDIANRSRLDWISDGRPGSVALVLISCKLGHYWKNGISGIRTST